VSIRLDFAWIGRTGDSPLNRTTEEYVGRVRRFFPAETRWIKEARGEGTAASADESRRLAATLHSSSTPWIFDPTGDELDSEELSRRLATDLERGGATFVVGGASGLDLAAFPRRSRTVSLSRLVFPHAVARLLVAEQVYRSLTIWRGFPYHK